MPLDLLLLSYAFQVLIQTATIKLHIASDTETALARWQVPGAVVIVVRKDATLYLQGHGHRDRERLAPVTHDTLFPLASCTKAFTATLLAMAVERGECQFDDPLHQYLPEFAVGDPVVSKLITFRDAMSHRVGIEGHDLLWYRAPWSIHVAMHKTRHLPLVRPFRSGYEYSSLMVMNAGHALEKATRLTWEQLIERLAKPMGMSSVQLTSQAAKDHSNRATGYHHTRDGTIRAMAAYEMREPNPAGSIHATGQDLAAWLKFQLNRGRVNGKAIIDPKQFEETWNPNVEMDLSDPGIGPYYTKSSKAHYAMGWVRYDYHRITILAHGGMIDGYRALMIVIPEKNLALGILCNLDKSKMPVALANTLLDRLLNLPGTDWHAHFEQVESKAIQARKDALQARNNLRKLNTRPSLNLDRYVGEYYHPAYGTGTLSLDNDVLVWSWSSFRCPLDHFQEDVFCIREGYFQDELLGIAVNNGEPVALRVMNVIFERKPRLSRNQLKK